MSRIVGTRRGAEVVQCYVRPAAGSLHRPARELGGFVKLWLDPGETSTAEIELDGRTGTRRATPGWLIGWPARS